MDTDGIEYDNIDDFIASLGIQDPPTLLDYKEQSMKDSLRYLSTLAIIASVGISVYLWMGQAFTLPLGLLAIVLGLAGLWLQNEAR